MNEEELIEWFKWRKKRYGEYTFSMGLLLGLLCGLCIWGSTLILWF